LIEGEIVARRRSATGTLDHLAELLASRLRGRAQVRVQSPIRLSERSEPQPDLALLRRRADFYRTGHPGPADTLLVVGVVDTSGAHDREVKLPLYARHGIPQTWLVDLTRNVIEVYRDPRPTGYAVSTMLAAGSPARPVNPGPGAVRTAFAATLPTTTWPRPVRPCVPMTMRIHLHHGPQFDIYLR
jgi:Uma2 family endonuclease